MMVADNLRDFLEHGNIRNAVNFPSVKLPRADNSYRIAVANANVPNMLGQMTTALAKADLNILDMINQSKGEVAYTMVDVESPVPGSTLAAIRSIKGVLNVRALVDGVPAQPSSIVFDSGEDSGTGNVNIHTLERARGIRRLSDGTYVVTVDRIDGTGAVVEVDVHRVQTSCGFGVPEMEFRGHRENLPRWAARRGEEGLTEYRAKHNARSIDGLPAPLP